jgi:alpha-beta hydrolase superfamily lysophospholipase
VTHGYAEHCGRYREVANALVAAGIATFTYDMRGHGQASGKRGHIARARELAAAIETFSKEVLMI